MRHRSGLTVLELLITLAILGVLVGIGYVAMRPNHALITAQEVQAMMRNARFEAVRLTRPVEVSWKPRADGSSQIEAYVLEPPAVGKFDITEQPRCGADARQRTEDSSITRTFKTYSATLANRPVTIDGEEAIYWLPNGIAWNCDSNQPVTPDTMKIVVKSGNTEVVLRFVGAFDMEVERK